MANPQIDQFMNALIWKAVPPIFLAGIAGLLLREGLQWLERRALRFGQDRRRRKSSGQRSNVRDQSSDTEPHCPICNTAMVKRTAKRGARPGSSFWGCPNYPKCRGTRDE